MADVYLIYSEIIIPSQLYYCCMSQLDTKTGYWAVQLDESSQLLTTFRTLFGRYCWQILPFGLNNSQDIFQARMDSILEDLQDVMSIADDVCVFGTTDKEHMPI